MKTVHCSYSELSSMWIVVVTTRYQFGTESRRYYFYLHASALAFAKQQEQ